jgi:hypothetical protein
MPNIPTRDGGFVFIADQDQANQRYQQEWGQQTPAKPAVAPQQQSKQEQQRQPAVGDYLTVGGIKKQYAGPDYGYQTSGSFEKVKKEGKTTRGFDLGRFLQQAGPEAARIIGKGAQELVNAPVAAVQQIGALTQGMNLGAALAGGPMGAGDIGSQIEMNPQLQQQRMKQQQAATEALQKTGKDVEGFSYGIRPNTPIVGPVLSEDSAFVQKTLKPKTALGQLAASVSAAIAFDVGAAKLAFKAPSMIGKTIEIGDKFVDIWKAKDIKRGVQMLTQYLVKDVAPNALQDAMFFMPQAPAAMQKDLAKIRQLETSEERIAAAKVLRATSPEEFNYAYEQLKNVAGGAVALTGLRGMFWGANRFLSKATSGVPVEKALDEAANEAVPIVQALSLIHISEPTRQP